MSLVPTTGCRRSLAPLAFGLVFGALLGGAASADEALVPLTNSKPGNVGANANLVGALGSAQTVQLAVTLPLRDEQGLANRIQAMYTKDDPSYHKFMTPEEITAKYGPTQDDYSRLAAYFVSKGLTVTQTHSNRLILDVAGPADAVSAALHVGFNAYKEQGGRSFVMADRTPSLPASLASAVNSIVGLDNAHQLKPQYLLSPKHIHGSGGHGPVPNYGSGHGGYLAPADIGSIYSINLCYIPNDGVQPTGSGVKVALYELDTTKSTTLGVYCKYYGLHTPAQTWVNVDGGPGAPGGGEVEVALDLDMVAAAAPNSSIFIYQAPNTWAAGLDCYNKIATDDKVSVVSTSWGLWEYSLPSGVAASEAPVFQEMAAEGMSVYCASGDYGAIDPDSYSGGTYQLSVLDPASQPYATGVGGTTLDNFASWSAGSGYPGEIGWGVYETYGSGGGVSTIWSIPWYQNSVIYYNGYNGASLYMRNVPDVALNADPATGYDVYSSEDGWIGVGGTSAAAPLWAGYTALVNQARTTAKQGNIGFASPAAYGVYESSITGYPGSLDFFDVTSGTNAITPDGGYNCGTGYDNVTGLGSFDAWQLFYEWVQIPTQLARPLPPASLTATPGTAGTHKVTVAWSKSLGAKTYLVYYSSSSGLHLAGVTSGTSLAYSLHLVSGTSYAFYVVAANAAGSSNYSSGVTATAP